MARVRVSVTLGDPWGIGPEVLAAALAEPRVRRACTPIVYGDAHVLAAGARAMGVRLPKGLEVVEPQPVPRKPWHFGRPPAEGGRFPIAYLEAAVAAAQCSEVAGLCTAPIHKASMARSGFGFAGHTDYLATRFGAERAVMLLAGPTLTGARATGPVPRRDVASRRTVEGGAGTLAVLGRALRRLYGCEPPAIAVCGVNPHAGEGGLLGDEEQRILVPAIRRARRWGLRIDGPLPADSLFAIAVRQKRWNAILAMAHDQGLGPLKVVDFERAVNVTLGLPLPRTSPDHGVAYDLAGTGRADPTSMVAALLECARLASVRRGG